MGLWLRRLFAAPIFKDKDKTRAANLLNTTLWSILATSILFCLILMVVDPEPKPTLDLLFITVDVIILGLIFFLHRGYVQLAGVLLSLALWVSFTIAAYTYDGIRDSAITGYFFVIIMASLVSRARAVIVFGMLSILAAVTVFLAETYGLLVVSLSSLPAPVDLVMITMSLGLSALLLRVAVNRQARANNDLQMEIREREQTEATLRQERNRAQQYLDVAGVMLVALNEEGRITLMNRKGRKILGFEEGELVGRNWFHTCLPSEVREEVWSLFQRLMAGETESTETHVQPVMTESGEERIIEWHNTLLTDETDEIVGTLSSGEDITERVRADEELHHRAAELETLAQVSSALRTTQTVEEMLPIALQKATQVIGATFGSIFLAEPETGDLVARASHPSDHHPLGLRHRWGEGITGHVAATGQVHTTQDLAHDPLAHFLPEETELRSRVRSQISLPLRTQEDTVGVMHIGLQKQRAFADQEVQLLTAVADIAANALYRAAVLETLEQRVVERTRELEEANARLQELDRLKSKFITDVSHELRTPVANINMYLHLLERGKPEKQVQYQAILKEQTVQLMSLTEDILNLSQLALDAESVEFAPVDLNALVEQIINTHQSQAEAAGLQLTLEKGAYLPPVRGRRDQLAQLSTNLVTNAVNYTPAGQVRVSTYLDKGQACLEVQDTGIGIEPQDLSHIFERFYRGQGIGSSAIPGTGLGLAIVKEIVELHGGEIQVKSQVGGGTTVRVWLPLEGQDT